MRQECWQLWADRGLLISPDPIVRLADALEPSFPIPRAAIDEIEGIARNLSELLDTRRVVQPGAVSRRRGVRRAAARPRRPAQWRYVDNGTNRTRKSETGAARFFVAISMRS